MKNSWIVRTKKFWHDDSAIFKFRKPIRRQASTPALSSFASAPTRKSAHRVKRSVSLEIARYTTESIPQDDFPSFCLLELPNELLDQIIYFLDTQNYGYESVQNLIALSATCHRLRKLCTPYIFKSRTTQWFKTGPIIDIDANGQENGFASLIDDNEDIARALESLRILQRKAYPDRVATLARDGFPDAMIRALGRCQKLRDICLDPPTELNTTILTNLDAKLLHVALDVRLLRAETVVALPRLVDLACESSFEWSLATGDNASTYDLLEAVLQTQRAKALCVDTMALQNHRRFPELGTEDYSSLEELHVSRRNNDEKKTRPQFLPPGSIILQICNLMPRFTALRRLRIEGSRMTEEVLTILPSLQSVEDLSMYSSCRSSFHPDCNHDAGSAAASTTDMPWLQLSRLKQLDIRYMCRHFSIEQFIPRGLIGLRIEFYSPEDQFTADEMEWLAEVCPDLERLEIDINIDHAETNHSQDAINSNDYSLSPLLNSLRQFKRLRKLRFFPTYWREGRFLAQPLPSIEWPLHIFESLKRACHHLSTLNVCISYGEYPMRLVSRLTPEKRPLKFVVEQSGYTDTVRLRYGFADSEEMVQRIFEKGQPKGPRDIVSVLPELFFDDLCEGWTFQQYEVLYSSSQIWLNTSEGQRYIDELEHESFETINNIDS